MKKFTLLTFSICLVVMNISAQTIEVQGKATITDMDTMTDVSANVVRLSDGTLALRQYKSGDLAQGGIVFYVDESGEHGLAADTVDLTVGTRWFAGTNGNTQARGNGPFAGEMNTAIIISSQVAIGDDGDDYAARLCADLQKGGYGDWYLPSIDELNLMYTNLQLEGLGGFTGSFYWSSTEVSSSGAFGKNFGNGSQASGDKNTNSVRVRPIRAF